MYSELVITLVVSTGGRGGPLFFAKQYYLPSKDGYDLGIRQDSL